MAESIYGVDCDKKAYTSAPRGQPHLKGLASNSLRKDLFRIFARARKFLGDIKRRCVPQKSTYTQGVEDSEWKEFYDRFEHRFRGSYSLIYERLDKRYGEILQKYQGKKGSSRTFLDLGCGHGELLELAKVAGFSTFGVDQSKKAMLNLQNKGHQCIQADILSFVREQRDQSFDVVSLMHVIEHCQPQYIFKVFKEIYRVLKPGGLFLVETPSLYSLWVAARQFYLDPTHLRPIHPEYVRFLGEDFGYSSILELHFDAVEHPLAPRIQAESHVTLGVWQNWFFGPMDVAFLFCK